MRRFLVLALALAVAIAFLAASVMADNSGSGRDFDGRKRFDARHFGDDDRFFVVKRQFFVKKIIVPHVIIVKKVFPLRAIVIRDFDDHFFRIRGFGRHFAIVRH